MMLAAVEAARLLMSRTVNCTTHVPLYAGGTINEEVPSTPSDTLEVLLMKPLTCTKALPHEGEVKGRKHPVGAQRGVCAVSEAQSPAEAPVRHCLRGTHGAPMTIPLRNVRPRTRHACGAPHCEIGALQLSTRQMSEQPPAGVQVDVVPFRRSG